MDKATLTIKKDESTGEYFLDFYDIAHLFENPDDVTHYEINVNDKESISIKFFDSNNNQVVPKK